MRYEQPLFRPPSEADSFILQATIGCSWNLCTYCAMYRTKRYRVRPEEEILADVREVAARYGRDVRKVFVADGDPLAMTLGEWEPILRALREEFPRLRRVSTYATARNLLEKTPEELPGASASSGSSSSTSGRSRGTTSLSAVSPRGATRPPTSRPRAARGRRGWSSR